MHAWQRLRHSLWVSIDSLLDQVENQEAVVTASMRDVEQGLSRIRVQRKRCERRIHALQSAVDTKAEEATRWRARVLRVADDRARALECLRRAHASEEDKACHAAELREQQALLQRVCTDEQAVEGRLSELRRRCAALSTREARTAALAGSETSSDLDAVFARWEARLEGSKVASVAAPEPDPFAQEFARAEQDADLEAELDRLLVAEQEPSQ